MKKRKKKEKGITLIALIITIVVLLILASVSIGAIKDSKIITHAQDAKKTYTEAQIKEEINLYSVDYYIATNRNMQEETKNEIINICKTTGIKPEQLTVHYDLYTKEEIILYRIDKTTEDEQEMLENANIYPLRGDIDKDGYLTQKDYDYISAYSYSSFYYKDEYIESLANADSTIEKGDIDGYFIKYGDFNADYIINLTDVTCIKYILNGKKSIEEYLEYIF